MTSTKTPFPQLITPITPPPGGIQETVSLAVGSGWEAPFTLEGEYSIIGHSVVLHADQDDLGLGNFDGNSHHLCL